MEDVKVEFEARGHTELQFSGMSRESRIQAASRIQTTRLGCVHQVAK